MKNLPKQERRILLNQETGQVGWAELERHFARGVVISVDASLDLVTVADKFLLDDATAIEAWYQDGLLQRTPDDCASRWAREQTTLWAIVLAPWVLVQERSG